VRLLCNNRHLGPGLSDFSWYNIPKRGKIYQISIKYTKWPYNRPNGHKIEHLPLQIPPKFTQIRIFGFKMSSGNPDLGQALSDLATEQMPPPQKNVGNLFQDAKELCPGNLEYPKLHTYIQS
jgi:hypothetical protein